MMDRVYLHALFGLAMEEAASGDAWFSPEAFAVLFVLLDLSLCTDPHWRFVFPWAAKNSPLHRETRSRLMQTKADAR